MVGMGRGSITVRCIYLEVWRLISFARLNVYRTMSIQTALTTGFPELSYLTCILHQ